MTATSERGTPSILTRKRSTSALALPSTGGAATLSLSAASPWGPCNVLVFALGGTRSLTRAPAPRVTRGLLVTPAEEAAGARDPAVFLLFPVLAVEELVRAALLGERRLLPLHLVRGPRPAG